jgi:O-antigen/teichoic acid export membrane protein
MMPTSDELQLDAVFEPAAPTVSARIDRRLAWLKKGSLALLDQGLVSGSNFLVAILLARWLTRDEYGAYAMGFSLFILLYGFHNAFLLEPMSVFGPELYAKRLTAYVKKLLGFHFALALILSLLVVTGIIVLTSFTNNRALTSALWGVCVAVPLILFYWICRRAAYLRFAPGLAVTGSAIYCLSVLILALALKSWRSPLMGFVIQSLAAIPAALLLMRPLKSGADTQPGPSNQEVLREHWRYGRWVMGSTLVTWISGYGYYVLVGMLLPMQDVAALRALRNLTEPCYRAMAAIILLVLPWASSRYSEEGRRGLQRRTLQLNLLFGGSALVYFATVALFGNKLMGLLYAGRYNGSSNLLLLATAPVVLIAASLGSEVAVQVMQAPSEVFLAYGVSGGLTLLLGIAFTRYWGLRGGLISILVSSAAVWVVLTYRCQKRLRAVAPEAERAPKGVADGVGA